MISLRVPNDSEKFDARMGLANMKNEIHPEYNIVKVRLADGTIIETKSTMGTEEYVSEVDSTNHPFYTGRRQYVDTAGRVEKFQRRYGKKK